MPYKTKSGWVAQVRVRGQKRMHRCKTRKEALEWEQQQRTSACSSPASRSLALPPVTNTVSLIDWANAYLDFARSKYVVKTYQEKRLAFALLLRAEGLSSRSSVSALSPLLLLRHFQKQAGDRSGNAANKDRKNLSAAWSWGVRFMGLPSENPFQRIPRQSEERSPRRVPTLSEFWAVYDAASTAQDKRMLLLYLYSGARRSELFALRWQDVDFEEHRIRLFCRKNREGSFRAAWVYLPDEAVQALEQQKAESVVCAEGFVFIDPTTGRPFQYRLQWLRRLCKRAGVERFGFHGLRHLCASILAARSVPLPDIQSHLRHENLTTTQCYVHSLGQSRAIFAALSGLEKARKKPAQ